MTESLRLIRLRFPKTCERCGGNMPAGETACMAFCEKSGKARFYHRVCPGAGATVERPKSRIPGFLRRLLGLGARRPAPLTDHIS